MPFAAVAVASLAIGGLSFAIYSDTLSFPFAFDDQLNITQNPGIRVGWDRGWSEVEWWRPTRRPVSNASFALNFVLGGYEVAGYRSLNVGIHVLTSLLVSLLAFQVLGRVGDRGGAVGSRLSSETRSALAVFSGLLFAAHPLATQSVVYVVQRMSSLSVLFYVAGLCAWIGSGRGEGGVRWGLRSLSLLLGLFSLGSKEIGATFPLVLWLWEWGFERGGSRRYVLESLPWLVGVFGVGLLLLWGYAGGDPLKGYAEKPFTLWERLWTEPRVWWRYVGLSLWPLPSRLSVVHGVALSSGPWSPWTTWLSWSGWLLMLGCSWRWWGRYRLLSALVVWWLLHQLVEGSVLPLEPMYEHRTYLPLVGLCVVAPWVVWVWLSGWLGRRAVGWCLGVGTGVVLALAAGAHARAQVWRDPLTLWSDALEKAPEHPRPHVNLGMALAAKGQRDEAIRLYDRAEALDPRFQEAHHNRAVVLQAMGRHEEAIVDFREALRLAPRDALAHEAIALSLLHRGEWAGAGEHLERAARIGRSARASFELARLRAADDRLDEALAWLEVALERAPGHPAVLGEIGATLARQGKLDAAAVEVDRSLALRDVAWVRLLQARIDWAAGRWERAIDRAAAAREQAPDARATGTTLAWMLLSVPDASLQDVRRALAVIRQGIGEADHPAVLEVRALLAAEEGRMQVAMRAALDAASAARERGAVPYAQALETQANGYAQGRRFRESVATARDRVMKGAWIGLPPRGSVNGVRAADRGASRALNSAADP